MKPNHLPDTKPLNRGGAILPPSNENDLDVFWKLWTDQPILKTSMKYVMRRSQVNLHESPNICETNGFNDLGYFSIFANFNIVSYGKKYQHLISRNTFLQPNKEEQRFFCS